MFGFQFSQLNEKGIVDEITRPLGAEERGAKIVVTANSDHVGRLTTDVLFRGAYLYASIRTADGFLVHYYAPLRGERIPRVTGCGILAELMRNRDLRGQRLFLVADGAETAAGLRKWAARRGYSEHVFPLGHFNSLELPIASLDRINAVFVAMLTVVMFGVEWYMAHPERRYGAERYHVRFRALGRRRRYFFVERPY